MSNLDQIYSSLAQQVTVNGEQMSNSLQGADMTDPAAMLEFQRITMGYQTAIGTESSMIKMVKDMLASIMQKI